MIFSIITFIVALVIAAIAAGFSIVGLMVIFSASAIPVALMAGSLEIGKLVTATWLYRNWYTSPRLLRIYLTVATVILMLITSMGIFGFLSKAHLQQTALATQNNAKIERIESEMQRNEIELTKLEAKIVQLETESVTDTTGIQEQLAAEQERMNNVYTRIQPTIDELNDTIRREQTKSDTQIDQLLERLASINESIDTFERFVENNDIRALQALVGTKVDGQYGPNTARAVDRYRDRLEEEKTELTQTIADLREAVNTDVIDNARAEIAALRSRADKQIEQSEQTIASLRAQLDNSLALDNTAAIEEVVSKIRAIENDNDAKFNEKFALETEIRGLEAEVGPIKYVAEFLYDDGNKDMIDKAVTWLIIVLIFVFDPLAVLLLIAANYSFMHRNDSKQQKEIVDVLFNKKEKVVDSPEEISDNSTIIEEPNDDTNTKNEKESTEQAESILDKKTHQEIKPAPTRSKNEVGKSTPDTKPRGKKKPLATEKTKEVKETPKAVDEKTINILEEPEESIDLPLSEEDENTKRLLREAWLNTTTKKDD